jgi:succinoglycan biosynthesis protein ExoM
MARPAPPRVAICVATYRRPLLLRALLDSLARLEFTPGEAPELHLIVVDNDAAASAHRMTDEVAQSLRWPVTYLVEPQRNIALARNRGVEAALAWGADLVAFVDDDERVTPAWLATLLAVQREYGADVVHGPVVPCLPHGTPDWLVRGGGFLRQRNTTGSRARSAATGNALVRARLLEEGSAEPFDPAFGLSGGSDALFFTRCERSGATIVWADDAVVEEHTIGERTRASWSVRRAFREGNAALFCERAQPSATRQEGRQVLRGFARLALGLGSAVTVPFAGRAGLLRAARHLAYGVGTLSALGGHRYFEYARGDEVDGVRSNGGVRVEPDPIAGNGGARTRPAPTWPSPRQGSGS